MLDQEKYRSRVYAVATAAAVNMGGQYKWKIGELEFESLMRMLDNLVSLSDTEGRMPLAHQTLIQTTVFSFSSVLKTLFVGS